jgi:uncharacterized protein
MELDLRQVNPWGRSVLMVTMNVPMWGSIHIPTGKQPTAGVVLSHGHGGNRDEDRLMFVWLANELVKAGLVVLRYDARGYGHSADRFTPDIKTFTTDVTVAFDKLRELFPLKKVGLLGLSMGGLASALAVAQRQVDALCMWEAPYDVLLGLSRHTWPIEPDEIERAGGKFNLMGRELGVNFVRALKEIDDPGKFVEGFAGAVQIVHGTADQMVPVESAGCWHRAFAKAASRELLLISGADHGFSQEPHRIRAVGAAICFFKQQLLS